MPDGDAKRLIRPTDARDSVGPISVQRHRAISDYRMPRVCKTEWWAATRERIVEFAQRDYEYAPSPSVQKYSALMQSVCSIAPGASSCTIQFRVR